MTCIPLVDDDDDGDDGDGTDYDGWFVMLGVIGAAAVCVWCGKAWFSRACCGRSHQGQRRNRGAEGNSGCNATTVVVVQQPVAVAAVGVVCVPEQSAPRA